MSARDRVESMPIFRGMRTLALIPDYKIIKVDDLLPWRWNR